MSELLPGLDVDVVDIVREYCDEDCYAYLYFDSIDTGTEPNDIEPADIWIANNLNGRIQLGEFAAISGRADSRRDEIRAALSATPLAAQLWNADEPTLRNAGILFDMLCGPRAQGSRMTKILHKKRPEMFPILDARVRPLFESVIPSVRGRSWEEYFVELGRVLGPWIVRNAEVLDTARKPYDRLTRLRAYDICLWRKGSISS
jgi:hypothetical protein